MNQSELVIITLERKKRKFYSKGGNLFFLLSSTSSKYPLCTIHLAMNTFH